MDYEDMKKDIKDAAYQTVKDVSDFAHEKISGAIENAKNGGRKKPVRYINTTYRPVEPSENTGKNVSSAPNGSYVPPGAPFVWPQQPMRSSQRNAQPARPMRTSQRTVQPQPPVYREQKDGRKVVPYQQKKDLDPLPQMRAVKKRSVAPFYLTSAFALGYVCLFGISAWWHVPVFLLLCLTVFGLLSLVFKGKTVYEKIEDDPEEAGKLTGEKRDEIPARCGIPEVDRLLHEGYGYIEQLKVANEAIEDKEVSANIDRMTETGTKIFRHVEENPGKAHTIRKFMNYYLPTTLKLLNSYYKLSKQGVQGENISGTMQEIERILYTIASAFDKQLDALFQNEALDVNADIAVMESMLNQENLDQHRSAP